MTTWVPAEGKWESGFFATLGDISPRGPVTSLIVRHVSGNTRRFWRVKRLEPWDAGP